MVTEVSIFQVAEVPTNMYNYTLPKTSLHRLFIFVAHYFFRNVQLNSNLDPENANKSKFQCEREEKSSPKERKKGI